METSSVYGVYIIEKSKHQFASHGQYRQNYNLV